MRDVNVKLSLLLEQVADRKMDNANVYQELLESIVMDVPEIGFWWSMTQEQWYVYICHCLL